ncbi:hypothetical protein [Mesorhizobium sp.]|uniref:hypothetical protein n=1 Tax=Mesorhizobium sp. TaxID=1871066 RepID=UPI000FE6AF27|nr:hypothetical protein [Mesorhizobium sp.]RWB69744.1 MAG: hypothetical protein EOQ49_19940 [Mesorhizobium sp.]
MLSIFRKKSPDAEVAKELLEEGDRLADEAYKRQLAAFVPIATTDELLGKFVDDHGDGLRDTFRWFELQFLWGFFHEYVQTRQFPTNGFSRILVHIIHRLIHKHGLNLTQARDAALQLEDLYNKADGNFELISELGKKSFHDHSLDDAMVTVFMALAVALAKERDGTSTT